MTDDFFDVKISVNGDYILECLYDALPESYVYVGIMNFKHRDEPKYPAVAISSIRVYEKESYIAFESASLQVNSDSFDSIDVVMKFTHKGLRARVESNEKTFRINSFFCGLCNTMELQTQIIPGNENSTVIIKGFKQIHISDEFSASPVLIGVDDTGKQRAIFGETVVFSLSSIFRRYFVEKRQLPKAIVKWFTPNKAAKIKLYNKTPVNSDFLGFGALYYPWIYQKDEFGRNYTESQAKTELDRLKLSGVRIVRVTLFASSDWYLPKDETWKFEGERFDAILRSLAEIQLRGIDILLNFEWGNSINQQGVIFCDGELAALPFDKQCRIFSTFVRDYLLALSNRGITAVKYLTFFSEPGSGFINGYNDEAGKSLLKKYNACIGAIHNSLKESGTREKYKFILGNVSLGTEMWNSTWQLFAPIYETLAPYGDEWSYHNYNRYVSQYTNTAHKFENMMTFVNNDIKEKTGICAENVWIDEYNARTVIIRGIKCATLHRGIQFIS